MYTTLRSLAEGQAKNANNNNNNNTATILKLPGVHIRSLSRPSRLILQAQL